MPRLLNFAVVVLAIAGGLFQFYLKPILLQLGYAREIVPTKNNKCTTVPHLQACEKVVLHQQTGIIYLACSDPSSRTRWLPGVGRLNVTGASFDDFIATYDPRTSQITRLNIVGSGMEMRGFSSHGMDVVPSSTSDTELFVYLVNHRAPLGDKPAHQVGADSVIEILKTEVGSSTLVHVKTVEDPVISTPNDVIGYPDGKSFYFTNDHGSQKVGYGRFLSILGRKITSVGYCHLDKGCKIAIKDLHGSNGIARAHNDTIYVGNAVAGGVSILERQRDNSLVLTDVIKTEYPVDNLSVDSRGHIWAAGLIDSITTVFKHFENPSVPAPSSALRISINTGKGSFYGDKYKVEKPFIDNGRLASGTTSAVYDAERKKLFLHGICAPHLTVCPM